MQQLKLENARYALERLRGDGRDDTERTPAHVAADRQKVEASNDEQDQSEDGTSSPSIGAIGQRSTQMSYMCLQDGQQLEAVLLSLIVDVRTHVPCCPAVV